MGVFKEKRIIINLKKCNTMEEKVIEKLNEVGLTPDDLTKEELERLKEEVKLEEDGIIVIDGVLSDSKIFYRRLNK